QEARAQFQEAVAVLKSLGARRELAIAAMVGLFLVEVDQIAPMLIEAVQNLRELGDPWWLAQILMAVAQSVVRTSGMLPVAKQCAEEAFSITRALNDKIGYGAALLSLGEIAMAEGDVAKSQAYFTEWFESDLPYRATADILLAHAGMGIVLAALGRR